MRNWCNGCVNSAAFPFSGFEDVLLAILGWYAKCFRFFKGLAKPPINFDPKNRQELNWAPAWKTATGQALMPKQAASVHATSCRASRWPGPPFRTAVLTRAVTWCQVQSGSLPSIITGRGGNIPCVNNSVNVLFFLCSDGRYAADHWAFYRRRRHVSHLLVPKRGLWGTSWLSNVGISIYMYCLVGLEWLPAHQLQLGWIQVCFTWTLLQGWGDQLWLLGQTHQFPSSIFYILQILMVLFWFFYLIPGGGESSTYFRFINIEAFFPYKKTKPVLRVTKLPSWGFLWGNLKLLPHETVGFTMSSRSLWTCAGWSSYGSEAQRRVSVKSESMWLIWWANETAIPSYKPIENPRLWMVQLWSKLFLMLFAHVFPSFGSQASHVRIISGTGTRWITADVPDSQHPTWSLLVSSLISPISRGRILARAHQTFWSPRVGWCWESHRPWGAADFSLTGDFVNITYILLSLFSIQKLG